MNAATEPPQEGSAVRLPPSMMALIANSAAITGIPVQDEVQRLLAIALVSQSMPSTEWTTEDRQTAAKVCRASAEFARAVRSFRRAPTGSNANEISSGLAAI